LDLAESRPTTSTHAPPRFVIVHDTNPKQGTIVLSPLRATIERVPVKQLVNVNGQIQERTIFYNRGKYHRDTLDARDSCVMTPDGTQLPIDEVWKRLKPGTVLVVSGDGNRPAPAYLRALRADALVFIPAPPMKLKP
jgi:hypothetical protein